MRLVACAHCHTQFDVSGYTASALRCHCGMLILISEPQGRTVPIARCGRCGAPWTAGADHCPYCGGLLDQAANLKLICPECYARNPESSRFCRGCGVAFHPEPVQLEDSKLACPRCSRPDAPAPLRRRALSSCWVCECHGCHGMWVGKENFEQLVDRTVDEQKLLPDQPPGTAPVREAVVYASCPCCQSMMQRQNFKLVSGVIIDRCARHGVWLDADELERIAHFLASGGLLVAQQRASFERSEFKRESRMEARENRPLQSRLASAFTLFGDD